MYFVLNIFLVKGRKRRREGERRMKTDVIKSLDVRIRSKCDEWHFPLVQRSPPPPVWLTTGCWDL